MQGLVRNQKHYLYVLHSLLWIAPFIGIGCDSESQSSETGTDEVELDNDPQQIADLGGLEAMGPDNENNRASQENHQNTVSATLGNHSEQDSQSPFGTSPGTGDGGTTNDTYLLQPDAGLGIDAFVHSYGNSATTNYGDNSELVAGEWTNNGYPFTVRSYLKFNLGPLPKNRPIISAKLSLFANMDSTFWGVEGHPVPGSSAAPRESASFLLQRVLEDWDEDTVTWDTKPSTTDLGEIRVEAPTEQSSNSIDIDVTSMIANMQANPSNNFGMMLRVENEERWTGVNFATSDAEDPYIRPRLMIELGPEIRSATADELCPGGGFEEEGFEDGNYFEWSFWTGWRADTWKQDLFQRDEPHGTRHVRITAPGDDPAAPGLETLNPIDGTATLQLGDNHSTSDKQSEAVRYTFKVTEDLKKFRFHYAVVLDDHEGNFLSGGNTHFRYDIIKNGNRIDKLTRKFKNKDDKLNWQEGDDPTEYLPWDCEEIDLSDYVDDELTIQFRTTDCSEEEHSARAYIDNLCSQGPASLPVLEIDNEFCGGEEVKGDASATFGETSYFVSIEPSDANGGRNVGLEKSKWFTNQQAGQINFTKLYKDEFKQDFQCNTYYRLKVAATNGCNDWDETVELVYIRCPVFDIQPDPANICLGDSINLQASGDAASGIYWTPVDGIVTIGQDGMDLTVSPTEDTTYRMTATDSYGCTGYGESEVHVSTDEPTGEILVEREACSDVTTLRLVAQDHLGFTWDNSLTSRGASPHANPIHISNLPGGEYGATLEGACGDPRVTIDLPEWQPADGSFPDLTIPNILLSNSSGGNAFWKIFASNSSSSWPNPYNASRWEVRVFNREGTVVYSSIDDAPSGLQNGEIANWDGRTPNGAWAADGTYYYTVTLYNCSNNSTTRSGYITVRESGQRSSDEPTTTPWHNRDRPGGSGDYEPLSLNPYACPNPIGIECVRTSDEKPHELIGEVVTCSTTYGFACRNSNQSDGRCEDYKVRLVCD